VRVKAAQLRTWEGASRAAGFVVEAAPVLGADGPQREIADLHEPSTNIRYGVRYLAEAWKLANGNLYRALMKYRAGHGEERFSARSVEYCRRARARSLHWYLRLP
jgi:soluble lytic murein transglycosylase-like protein